MSSIPSIPPVTFRPKVRSIDFNGIVVNPCHVVYAFVSGCTVWLYLTNGMKLYKDFNSDTECHKLLSHIRTAIEDSNR